MEIARRVTTRAEKFSKKFFPVDYAGRLGTLQSTYSRAPPANHNTR